MHRVLAVAQSPELGGAEYGLLRIARRLPTHGIEARLAVPAEGPLSEAAREHGIEVHHLPVGGLRRGGWAGALPSLARAPGVRRSAQPRLVYFNGVVAQRLAYGFPGMTLVPHLHDFMDAAPRPWRSRGFWSRTPVVLCDSRALAKNAERLGAPAERLLPVGCPVEPVEPAPRPGWAEGEVVGYVGRIEPRKGTLDLMQAAREVLARRERARLVLVGGDEMGVSADYAQRVRRAAEALGDRAVILPSTADAARYMPWFDVLCVPSREEPFGTVAAEALAAGTPVVATRSGGMAEYVVDGVSGALVPPGAPGALATALERVLDGAVGSQDEIEVAAAPFHVDRVTEAVAGALLDAIAGRAAERSTSSASAA